MSEGKKYFCFCGSNCKYETMTKEQILAAITQAVETGSIGDVDTGFITKVKETNGGRYVTFWVGTQAEYNALETKATNCLYIISDDTSGADLENRLQEFTTTIEDGLQGVNRKIDTLEQTDDRIANNVQGLREVVGADGDQPTGIFRTLSDVGHDIYLLQQDSIDVRGKVNILEQAHDSIARDVQDIQNVVGADGDQPTGIHLIVNRIKEDLDDLQQDMVVNDEAVNNRCSDIEESISGIREVVGEDGQYPTGIFQYIDRIQTETENIKETLGENGQNPTGIFLYLERELSDIKTRLEQLENAN